MLRNTVLEAKAIWKGYNSENGSLRWVLQGADLEILEGDFIAILGGPDAGKTALMKVLGFREKPDQGEVYFEGRLVGRGGEQELAYMRDERVWLINGTVRGNRIMVDPGKRLAAVLIDDPAGMLISNPDSTVLEQIQQLTSSGVAVVIATREPAVAARASSIYKLNQGKLDKLTAEGNQ